MKKLITISCLVVLATISFCQTNVSTILKVSGSSVEVYLNSPSTETVAFSSFYLAFSPLVSGATISNISSNPYAMALDGTLAVQKGDATQNVAFIAAQNLPILVLQFSNANLSGLQASIIFVELNSANRTGSVVLPISLKSFTAQKVGSNNAELAWVSASEVNALEYQVERSTDAQTWQYIGTEQVRGSIAVETSYSYLDRNIVAERSKPTPIYYRLKMIDTDGSYKYSDIRGITLEPRAAGTFSVFPNPSSAILNVDFASDDVKTPIQVQLYDVSGKLVRTHTYTPGGLYTLDVHTLPQGSYNVVATQGDVKEIAQVLITN